MSPELREVVASYGVDPDSMTAVQCRKLQELLRARAAAEIAEANWLEVLRAPDGNSPNALRAVRSPQ